MKKLLAILACLLILCSFAACAAGSKAAPGNELYADQAAAEDGISYGSIKGGGIPVKDANQHGNFCQTCLPGSIQAAVAADDFIFIAVFNGTDDQRGKNTILPDTFRKSSHLLVVLYLVGMAFKRAQLFNS